MPDALIHSEEYIEIENTFNLNEKVILKDNKNYGKMATIISKDNKYYQVKVTNDSFIPSDIATRICSERIHEINSKNMIPVKDAGEMLDSHGTIINRITGSVRLDLIIKEWNIKISIDIGLQLKDHRKEHQTVCNE